MNTNYSITNNKAITLHKNQFSFYISPLDDQWRKGEIGEELGNFSYFTQLWNGPHFTLTKFQDITDYKFGISNDVCKEVNCDNKDRDINKKVLIELKNHLGLICKDVKENYYTNNPSSESWQSIFLTSSIIVSKELYVLVFNPISYFEKYLDKLKEHNFNVKSNKFHITLGTVNDINNSKILKKEVEETIQNKKISNKLLEYFSSLTWCFTLVTLETMPVKWYEQIKI